MQMMTHSQRSDRRRGEGRENGKKSTWHLLVRVSPPPTPLSLLHTHGMSGRRECGGKRRGRRGCQKWVPLPILFHNVVVVVVLNV